MAIPLFDVTDPELCIGDQLQRFKDNGVDCHTFVVTYPFHQYYLPDQPAIRLAAVVALSKTGEAIAVGATVTDRADELVEKIAVLKPGWDNARTFSHQFRSPWLTLNSAVALEPVAIAKPWGREIWYSGIEQRGQSLVSDGRYRIPLPWLLSLAPGLLMGDRDADVVLLKILDPLPEPVYGDLYFEMHREKREVYIVTHVDRDAWPDGIGGIRMGFVEEKRAGMGDDDFKERYLAVVEKYRSIRQRIDGRLDQHRQQAGIALHEPVSAEQIKVWLNQVPEEWVALEVQLRAEMEAFYALHPLAVGDVVKVPRLVPHSLLHGVRTIEFQTPVYERKILSFGQKVLTQAHWDTEEALQEVQLTTPPLSELELLAQDDVHRREMIVSFEDFIVERIQLHGGATLELNHDSVHRLVMGVIGETRVGDQPLAAEHALFIPAAQPRVTLHNPAGTTSVLLLAIPNKTIER